MGLLLFYARWEGASGKHSIKGKRSKEIHPTQAI